MGKKGSRARRLRRRVFDHARVRAAIARAYGLYIGFVFRTSRWRWEGTAEWERRIDAGDAIMIVVWHDRLAMIPFAIDWRRCPHCVLASDHRDADFAVVSSGMRGMDALRLDSDAANVGVLRQAVRIIRNGTSFTITPDGPRGPRHKLKQGALDIAAMAGVPIVPASCSFSRSVTAKSWDRFLWPLPFSRGVFRMGEAVELPRRPDAETLRQATETLQARIDALDAACDAEVGRVAPESP